MVRPLQVIKVIDILIKNIKSAREIFEGGPGQVLDLSAKGPKKVFYFSLNAAFWGVKMAH